MGKKVQTMIMTPNGPEQKFGELMNIVNSKEQWSEYELEDGNKLKIKQVVTKIIKLDELDPLGNPIYVSEAQHIMTVE